jgi:two-component system, NtrC family, sensor kinase
MEPLMARLPGANWIEYMTALPQDEATLRPADIAAENVRLRAELAAALARQTATSEILRGISGSPTDVQPVFDSIVLTAARLFRRDLAFILACDATTYWPVATAGPEGLRTPPDPAPVAIDTGANFPSRVIVSRKNLHLPDWSAIELPEYERMVHERIGMNSALYLPLLRGGECIGLFGIAGKQAGIFGESEIALAESFRDQALIAIENTRLFNETKEALERQTATADILKVIASSPSDVQPVFEAIATSANKLLGGFSTSVCRFIDGALHLMAFTPTNAAADKAFRATFPAPVADIPLLELVQDGKVAQVADTEAASTDTRLRTIARSRGFRSMLFTPLISNGVAIGMIGVTRPEPGSFAAHHVQLLQTFADQAVIAIENVRLFDEVQARTRDLTESLQQQTATAEVLKVISRSTFDLKTVLDTLIGSAAQLCDAGAGHIYLREGEAYKLAACAGFSVEYEEFLKQRVILPGRDTLIGRTSEEGRIVVIRDALADPEYQFRDAQRLGKFRTMLGIPMLRDGEPIGVLALTRSEVRTFTNKQIELVTTFADQAVIAIENVRLFVEVQARTKELSQSLDELRTAQDRLVQTEKLASLGQLTAGIAHEIKNPLNFVNNFSSLSAELIDELNDVLKQATLSEKIREEVDELTQLLKDNLEKVVQHGKRADSIVKNMLLHSREGSGDHRPADINALLDESLNLAYHGARAEKPQFNVTLQRSFDDTAGEIEVFPQEITRVFLNLISNGFYAVTKRKAENGNPDFEPAVMAATRNLGGSVEIRIRDNGTGIPAEVREKMFNPFFTTKPAGEGTGLGLSMSHDIIVKQHGGRIDVATEPGQFTEFTIVLPRKSNQTNNQSDKIGGPT